MAPSRAIILNPPARSRLGLLVGMVVLLTGVFAVSWLNRPPPAGASDAGAAAQVALQPGLTAPAPSLQGTVPDGQLHDGGAELVLSPELIRRFDYWLTTHGEKPLDAVRADIRADLSDELNAPSLQVALRLLNAYVAYKTELASLQALPMGTYDSAALAQQLQAIRSVRSRHFNEVESLALFGPDDAEDDHALARLRITQDPSLSAQERSRQLALLSQRLSPGQRAAESEPVLHLSVADAVAEARARGADATEVRAIRARMVGPEAAERLARVDAEQADWQARVQGYLALKRERPTDAAAHKSTQFTQAEQLRLAAYE